MFENLKIISKKYGYICYAAVLIIFLWSFVWYGAKNNSHIREDMNSRRDAYFTPIWTELENLHNELKPLPGAAFSSYRAFDRSNNGYVVYRFSTELSMQEALTHYDKELKEKGWIFEKVEKEYIVFEGDTGSRTVVYSKNSTTHKMGEYVTTINYHEGETENPATFKIKIIYYKYRYDK